MRTYDLSPLFRSTVGFDRWLDMLNATSQQDWPPYDIERSSENQYRISMAVAGFGPDEIEMVQQADVLTVTGRKKSGPSHEGMLHQGLTFHDFTQTFSVADHVKITNANLSNGLLCIDLVREVPEQLKPRRIEIGTINTAVSIEGSRPKLVEQDAERQSKVA
jgi:molecular chaperone IbpA